MYQLFYTWKSAAMGPHVALEEIGVPYELKFIDFDQPWPEDYLRLNPHRKVPTLVDDAGNITYQSTAILLHLADCHPEAGLAPAPGTPQRARLYQILFFMAEMLQPTYQMHFYPERHTTDVAGIDGVDAKATEWLTDLWARIDALLGDGPYFLGEAFSVADCYMIMLAVWNQSHHTSLRSYPNVWRAIEAIAARPSTMVMLEHNGIDGAAAFR
ncbi:MAG: glutathione S-transferase family protein [Rhodospirillaceae bacterium]|jgi:glutathione S-transferase|nr:glutathione S-transferase family protein [Rhodospirillaceae bacterium]MBT6202280.1 glutathione S-transferase family protein [Rhodospirillaceae bacterium]MBT6509378.1 glutathione S-transferase family protein [Rhodospirillaceae bacterium]MBT7646861.1 glutathione S-transferase family protein [Rhodospirillaceae bacterium]